MEKYRGLKPGERKAFAKGIAGALKAGNYKKVDLAAELAKRRTLRWQLRNAFRKVARFLGMPR